MLRILHNTTVWYEFWRISVICFLIGVFFIAITKLLLGELNLNNIIKMNITDPQLLRSYRWVQIKSKIKLHNWLSIFERMNHIVTQAIGPFMLLLGLIIVVVGNYGSIRMYGKVHPALYAIFPTSLMIAILQISSLVPRICKLHTVSREFLRQFKKIGTGKLEKRYANSLRIVRVNIGSFFYCSKEFNMIFFAVIVDYTVNALLLL